MSELINKYTELHDEFIDALVEYHTLHLLFLERQSPSRTSDLRKVLKRLRLTAKAMEQIAQLRKKERSVEWSAVNRIKKDNTNE